MSSAVAPADDSDAFNEIELLKDECGGLMMQEGIATLTFYKGDFAAAAAALRAQLARVVAANPWLAGRLVKTKAGVRLRHPVVPTAADVDILFHSSASGDASSAFTLTPAAPYGQICTEMYKAKTVIVGSGSAILAKGRPVMLLTLAEAAAGDIALVFSISHAVADGRTYYEVFKMLTPGAAVRELQTTRVMAFSETMRDACGRKELAWVDKPTTMIGYTLAMAFNPKVKCFAFELDPGRYYVARRRREAPAAWRRRARASAPPRRGRKCGAAVTSTGLTIPSDGMWITPLTPSRSSSGWIARTRSNACAAAAASFGPPPLASREKASCGTLASLSRAVARCICTQCSVPRASPSDPVACQPTPLSASSDSNWLRPYWVMATMASQCLSCVTRPAACQVAPEVSVFCSSTSTLLPCFARLSAVLAPTMPPPTTTTSTEVGSSAGAGRGAAAQSMRYRDGAPARSALRPRELARSMARARFGLDGR